MISNSAPCLDAAARWWAQLLGVTTETIPLGNGLAVLIAGSFQGRPRYVAQTGGRKLLGIGTFFSDRGFGVQSLDGIDPGVRAEDLVSSLYGHYVLVAESEDAVKVIPDPLGMIDVFWATHHSGEHFCISNSMLSVARATCRYQLDRFGVLEFLAREATVGTDTLFAGVARLRLGAHLVVSPRGIVSAPLHSYVRPDFFDLESYQMAVSGYFTALLSLHRVTAVELSAGFDTRTVLACTSRHARSPVFAITNDNLADRGVDCHIGSLLAQRLGIEHTVARVSPHAPDGLDRLLFILDAGRDIFRSRRWCGIAQAVYASADLLLGGYGGEVLRDKHTGYGGWEGFCRGYYGKDGVLAPLGVAEELSAHLTNRLRDLYVNPWLRTADEVDRWLYACDRMRIWGGVRVRSRLFWGDSLHPFMDWRLLGPLIFAPSATLADGRFQYQLIAACQPSLLDFPINPSAESLGRNNEGGAGVSLRVRKHLSKWRRGGLRLAGKLGLAVSDFERLAVSCEVFGRVESETGVSLRDLQLCKRESGGLMGRFVTVVLAAQLSQHGTLPTTSPFVR